MKSFKEFCECVVRFDKHPAAHHDHPEWINTAVAHEFHVHPEYEVIYAVVEDMPAASGGKGIVGLFGEYTDDNGCHTYHTMIGNAEYTSLLMGGMMEILYREHYIPESCSQYNLPIKPSELINLRRTLFNVLREMNILHGECVEAGNEQDGEREFQALSPQKCQFALTVLLAQIDSIRASISAVDDGIYGDVEARVDADMALEQTLKGEET